MASVASGGSLLPAENGLDLCPCALCQRERLALPPNPFLHFQSSNTPGPEPAFLLALDRKDSRRSPSRARRCSPTCPLCALQRYGRGRHLQRWHYRAIAPEVLPPSIKSHPSHPPLQNPPRDIPRLEPSSIYTLIYQEHPGIYSFALYLTRSVPWKPGFLCRGTLDHPASCGIYYHQRKANLCTQAASLLAAVRIGSLDGVNGRKLLRYLASVRVESHELTTATPTDIYTIWWKKALDVLWAKGYIDCAQMLDVATIERELSDIAREREAVFSSGTEDRQEVAVCDSQWFI